MNTSQYMDKQIMDLSAGGGGGSSPRSHTKPDFIDFMNTHNDDHHHHVDGGNGNGSGNPNPNPKKDEILPNYDFQPIRPVTVSQSPNLDGVNVGGAAGSRVWNSADSKTNTNTATGIRSYGSLESVEPAKVITEKDRNVHEAAMVSEIDRTMKKYADNLLHALEGISARLTQLETRTRHLENSVDDLQVSVGNNHGSTDGKMRQLENILREVHTGVQVIRDNQEKVEAQLQLTKLQMLKGDQHPEIQNAAHRDSVQQTQSAPQESLQQLPPPVALSSSLTSHHPPNAPPPPPPPQHYLPPQVQVPNQYSQNQNPPGPQREPYFQPPGQAQEAPSQQYLLPPTQQPQQQLPPPAAPHQQYPPTLHGQYSQPPQQLPSLSPVNPPQPQPSLSHHPEEMPYPPSQSYPPSLRQSPSHPSHPTSGAPPSQQFYGTPSHMYEPPSGRSNSGFSGYGSQTGPNEPYSYSGAAPQYSGSSTMKQQQLPPSAMSQGGGSGYPQLPTARILPQAIPTASGASSGSGSTGTGNRVPIDDVVDKVTTMGFPREVVRATVRKLTENGQSVDLNIVLDKLMNDGDVQPPKGGWFGR